MTENPRTIIAKPIRASGLIRSSRNKMPRKMANVGIRIVTSNKSAAPARVSMAKYSK